VTNVTISDTDNPTAALDQLQAMADKMRAASPQLSPEQAFAAVFEDPRNAALAARERSEARSRLPTVGGR
jgi:hypothetical protein